METGTQASEVTQRPGSKSRRGAAVALFTAVVVVFTAGLGYGLWSASGTGNGEARAATAVTLTVSTGTASAQLYPGASGDVVFSVTNPNPYDVSVSAWSGASVTSTSDETNCPTSNFALSVGSITPTTVNGGSGTGTVTVAGGVSMVSGAPDGCQGETVTVSATLTGTQL